MDEPNRPRVAVILFGVGLLTLCLLNFLSRAFFHSALGWQRSDQAVAHQMAIRALKHSYWSDASAKLAIATATRPDPELQGRVLAMNPADAFTWGWYTVMLSSSRTLGEPMRLAVQRVWELAPSSMPLARQQSTIAAFHWRNAGDELRASWRPWIRLAMREPKKLAFEGARFKVEVGLCAALAKPHELERWCEIAPGFRRRCDKPFAELTHQERYRCGSAGFLRNQR